MLIPLKHENMTARRWPVMTLALIAINIAVFIATLTILQTESPELGKTKAHIIILAAHFPDANLTPEASELVENFRANFPGEWKRLSREDTPPIDEFDLQLRESVVEYGNVQKMADQVCAQYALLLKNSFIENYAFVPAHPNPWAYLTANFLHGGWMHLIFNMWFLWLAGFVLEDSWGRTIYTGFYLVAGAAAIQVHAWMNAGSAIPMLGASGAVAALMGAFLVRYPNMKIEMLYFIFLRPRKFEARAIWLLPLWLLGEVFSAALFGQMSGTAHWAHIGGFLFGAAFALVMRYSGVEHVVNRAIETEVSPTGNPDIDKAKEALELGRFDEAAALATSVLERTPDSLDALSIQRDVHWRRNEVEQYLKVSEKLCGLYLRAKAPETAIEIYNEYLAANGPKLQATTWMSLCRGFEELQNYERAATEYESLVFAYPNAPQSITATMAAARLCLKKINRPQDALRLFEMAEKSPVPHLDMETMIQAGIREAQSAISGSAIEAKATV